MPTEYYVWCVKCNAPYPEEKMGSGWVCKSCIDKLKKERSAEGNVQTT